MQTVRMIIAVISGVAIGIGARITGIGPLGAVAVGSIAIIAVIGITNRRRRND